MFKGARFLKENFLDTRDGEREEAKVLEVVDTSGPGYRLAEKGYQQSPGDKREPPFIDLGKSMQLVKEFQKERAFDPPTQFLKELRIEVADRLGLDTDEEMKCLGIFTAIGRPRKTSLDYYHGIDAFITYKEEGLPEIAVTLDISWSDEKSASTIKADIFVDGQTLPSPKDDEKFLETVEKYANQAATLLNKRIDFAKHPPAKSSVRLRKPEAEL